MVREQKNNYAALSGEVIQEPIYSHSAGGEDYFTFPLRCLRLSGAEDLLNLVLSRTQLEQLDGRPGDRVGVVGQVRSYNNHSGQGSKLVITVRVQALFPAPAQEDSNQVRLVGNLCRKPVYRRTPLGREIADLLLAVNRGCGKADYLPCIAWGGLARRCGALEVGDGVRIEGRLQSRAYTKVDHGVSGRLQSRRYRKVVGSDVVEKVAYEVSGILVERVVSEKSLKKG